MKWVKGLLFWSLFCVGVACLAAWVMGASLIAGHYLSGRLVSAEKLRTICHQRVQNEIEIYFENNRSVESITFYRDGSTSVEIKEPGDMGPSIWREAQSTPNQQFADNQLSEGF